MADDAANLAVDAPVNEKSEALVAEPFEPLGLVERADGGVLDSGVAATTKCEQGDEEEGLHGK